MANTVYYDPPLMKKMKKSEPLTTSSGHSELEHLFYKLCQEFGVDNINSLPKEARQALVDSHTHKGRSIVGKPSIIAINQAGGGYGRAGYAVNLSDGTYVSLPSQHGYEELYDILMNGDKISIDEIFDIHDKLRMANGTRRDRTNTPIYKISYNNGTTDSPKEITKDDVFEF